MIEDPKTGKLYDETIFDCVDCGRTFCSENDEGSAEERKCNSCIQFEFDEWEADRRAEERQDRASRIKDYNSQPRGNGFGNFGE